MPSPFCPRASWALRFFFALTSLLLLTAGGLAAQTTAPQWLHKARVGDVVFFTFASPARVERYDLASQAWLAPIALTNTPAAFAVDASGMSVAYGRTIYTRALDGSGETALYNSSYDVRGLLHSPGFIVVVSGSSAYPYLTTLRRSDRQFIATWSGYYSFGGGLAIDPEARRVYGIDTYTSGSSLHSITFSTTGAWPTGYPGYITGPATHYGYNSAARTYLAPDASSLVLGTGHVYDPASLAYRASLAGAFDDMAYHGADVFIVLRGDKLVAYDNTFLASGSRTLAKPAQGVAVSQDSAFAFSADATSASGISVAKVALSSLTTAVPGAAPEPERLDFIPDHIIPGPDDTAFLYSRAHKAIFSWDATTRAYGPSFVLGGVADHVAYSPTLNRLYTGYATGEIKQIKLDEGASHESPFVNLPTSVLALQAAGPFVFAMDSTGAWGTHWIYSSAGALKSSREWAYYSRNYVWSSVQKKLYHFRDNTSPNDLLATPISDAGVVGASTDSPYHGDYSFTHPIRLSSDQTGVLTGPGRIFSATSLALVGSLANAITDGTSINNRWHTIRANGNDTQLQSWSQSYLFERGLSIPGFPLRLLPLSDGRLLALTSSATTVSTSYPYGSTAAGRVVFSIVDLAGDGSVSTPAYIGTPPASVTVTRGKSATLSVTARGSEPFTYEWAFEGEPIPGASSATLLIASVQDSHAGRYTVKVSNAFGHATSSPATLTVNPPPPAPVITTQPVGRVAQLGSYFTLSVTATGTGLSYQWYQGEDPVAGATSASLAFSGFTAAAYGDYTVVVTNEGGEVRSAVAKLIPPPPPVLLSHPVDRYALPGGTATFSASATLNGATVQWRRDGANITGATSLTLSLSVTELSFGQYDVVLTNSAGSVTSHAAKLLRAQPATIVTSPADTAVFRGGDALFTVSASGAPASFTYQWQRYSVATARWINIVNDGVFYDGANTAQLAALNVPSASHGLQLRCLVGNGYGATAESAAATLTVNTPPLVPVLSITTQPRPQFVSVGGVATFFITTNSTLPLTYQWYHDGAAIPDSNAPSLVLDPVKADAAGNYTVLVSSEHGSVMSLPGKLTLSSSAPTLTAHLPEVGRIGESLVLSVSVTGHPAPTIVWRRDKLVLGTGPELELGPLTLSDAGSYTVTATNSAGAASATIRVAVRPPAPAEIGDIAARTGSVLDLALDHGIARPGLRFLAAGLPAGLKLDAETGRLTGTITARPGDYAVRLWTQFGSAKSEVSRFTLSVSAFPASLVGAYDALFAQTGDHSLPWGRLQFKVAANGQFTGTWQSADAPARSVRGRFELHGDEDAALALITPPGSATLLRVALDPVNGSYAEAVAADEVVAEALSLRLRERTDGPVSCAGAYTLGLGYTDVIENYGANHPPLAAHGTARVTTQGALTARLRLGDGTPLTLALPAYAEDELQGYYRCFTRPHAKGNNYLGGWFTLLPDDEAPDRYRVPVFVDSSTLHWKKAPQTDGRLYPAGFGPTRVELIMNTWIAPDSANSLSSLLGGSRFALGIDFAGLSGEQIEALPAALVLDGRVLRPGADTPAALAQGWRLQVNPANGSFTGTVRIAAAGAAGKALTLRCEGVLLQPASHTYALSIIGSFDLPATADQPKRGGALRLDVVAP